MAEASDIKFGKQLRFAKAHHKITPREKRVFGLGLGELANSGGWPWAKGAPQNFGVPYNISATDRARDFKFGTQLGFAKTHYKNTPREKVGVALG